MNSTKILIGQKYRHTQLGAVIVNHFKEGSRTIVDVTVTDKGEGWDDELQKFNKIKTVSRNIDEQNKYVGDSLSWRNGMNPEFGHNDEVHVNTLADV